MVKDLVRDCHFQFFFLHLGGLKILLGIGDEGVWFIRGVLMGI